MIPGGATPARAWEFESAQRIGVAGQAAVSLAEHYRRTVVEQIRRGSAIAQREGVAWADIENEGSMSLHEAKANLDINEGDLDSANGVIWAAKQAYAEFHNGLTLRQLLEQHGCPPELYWKAIGHVTQFIIPTPTSRPALPEGYPILMMHFLASTFDTGQLKGKGKGKGKPSHGWRVDLREFPTGFVESFEWREAAERVGFPCPATTDAIPVPARPRCPVCGARCDNQQNCSMCGAVRLPLRMSVP